VHRKQKGRPLQGGLICCRSLFGKIGCGGPQPQKADIALPNLALLAVSYLQRSSVNNIEIGWPLSGVNFVLVMRRGLEGKSADFL
jgi:hypothetical protein